MLHLVFANRYETLATALLRDLATPLSDPLAEEIIIIPSTAMRRRLELDYAQCFGVCANIRFAYLAQWLWEHLGRVVPVPETSPFAPNQLVWPIYECLSDAGWAQDAPRLAGYLAQADDVMRYELASRLASVFDQYLTYRLPWLASWQAGKTIATVGASPMPAGWGTLQQADEQWQAALWRRLLARLDVTGPHPAQRFLDAIEYWPSQADGAMPPGWPARISLFALPAMPPQPLQLLKALARLIDVHIYVLNPCQEYWYEIVPPSRLGYLAALKPGVHHDHRDSGHPLLAEWGRQTQSHVDLLYAEMTESAVADEAFFVPNPQPTLLAALQNSLLTLDPDYAEHAEMPPEPDGSVAIHVCHSLSRQLEVLRDHLLAWFDADPSLRPDEILVTVPDLAAAAPMIDSVFGTSAPRIPYLVTGLPPSRTNPVARAFALMLALPERQVAASDIVELARTAAVAQRYDLDERALDDVQYWLHAAGARRGWETANDASGGDVVSAGHTLGDALMRLLLGYALPDRALPVAHWLPTGAIEGGRTAVLGSVAQLASDLEANGRRLLQAHPALDWRDILLDMLATCFAMSSEHAEDVAELRNAIEQLCTTIHERTPDLAVPLGVIRTALSEWLDDPARGGVPSGRVTFAALPSLRGLPYRAVCLLGMDDGVLPGPQRDDEFDLMRAMPQRGDRQRRNDERNLFLDLLLAARDRVWLAYSGRSIRDNAPLPPAAVVDELLDELARMLAGSNASESALAAARASLVTEHPLQPFSPRYFDASSPALFSYDATQCDAARVLADNAAHGPSGRPDRFFTTPLPSAADAAQGASHAAALTLDDLQRFWRHPARFWLREQLGITLREADADIDDDEPFVLDRDGRAALAARLLPRLLEGDDESTRERVALIAAASHELPDGATGAVWREREVQALAVLAGRVRAALASGSIERRFSVPLLLDLPDDVPADWVVALSHLGAQPHAMLDGRLDHLTPNGMVLYRYGQVRPADRLTAWLAHLAFGVMKQHADANDAELAVVPHRTLWLGDGEAFALRSVDDPATELGRLAALYRVGQTRPLPFFLRSSWNRVADGQPASAEKTWHGSPFSFGEKEDAYHRLAWRGIDDALAEPFGTLASAIFGPLVAHCDEEPA